MSEETLCVADMGCFFSNAFRGDGDDGEHWLLWAAWLLASNNCYLIFVGNKFR